MLDNYSLQLAVQNGIIDEDEIRMQIEMYEKKYYLDMHGAKIWQGKDGGWYTYLPDNSKPGNRRLIRKVRIEKLKDAIVKHYKENANEPRIEDVFNEWVERKLKYGEIKKQSYDRYKVDFDRFFGSSKLKTKLFRHITEDMLDDFIRGTIHDFGLTAKGWGNLRILINGIFKYGKRKGYTSISISSFMGDLELSKTAFRKRIFRPEESVFRKEEIQMIRNYFRKSKPSIINLGILLGFETGLRVGEISTLKASDLDLDHNKAVISRTEIRYKNENGRYVYGVEEATKGRDGIREILLSDGAVKILRQVRRINPFCEYLFTSQITGERLPGKNFTEKLRKTCARLGIAKRSMHKTRKTYATMLINGGASEGFITRQMGHTDITTTRRFYYFDNQDTEKDLECLRSILPLSV